jgi:hypothetical protein
LQWRHHGLEGEFEAFMELSWFTFARNNLPNTDSMEEGVCEEMNNLYSNEKSKFNDLFKFGWSDYARKNWSEIDQYFLLPDMKSPTQISKCKNDHFAHDIEF